MKSLLKLWAAVVIPAIIILASCGDDNSSNPSDTNSNYIKADITGNAIATINAGNIQYNVDKDTINLMVNEQNGNFVVRIPSGKTGQITLDNTTRLLMYSEMSSTKPAYYYPVSGFINIEVNDASKVKGTFEYNGKLEDGTKSIVVKNGKFQYIIK